MAVFTRAKPSKSTPGIADSDIRIQTRIQIVIQTRIKRHEVPCTINDLGRILGVLNREGENE
jgi:hypothetical protein